MVSRQNKTRPGVSATTLRSIYDGREPVADIRARGGAFVVDMADGTRLGLFPDQKTATAAVFDYRRQARGAGE